MPYMVGIGNHEQDHSSGGSKDPSGAPGEGWHPWWGNFGDDSGGECGVPMYYRFHMPDNGNAVWWWVYVLFVINERLPGPLTGRLLAIFLWYILIYNHGSSVFFAISRLTCLKHVWSRWRIKMALQGIASSPLLVSKASREGTRDQVPRTLASPLACCSRVTSRDSSQWRICSQAM